MRLRRIATTLALTLVGILTALACPTTAHAASTADCHRVHQQNGPAYGLLNNINLYAPVGLDLGITDNALGLLGGYATQTGAADTYDIHCGN